MGRTQPPIAALPPIAPLLGYDPCPQPKTLPQHLLARRRTMGWSIKQAARELGVDPASWGNWERGQTVLYRHHRALVARLLNLPADTVDQDMASRWNQSHDHAL